MFRMYAHQYLFSSVTDAVFIRIYEKTATPSSSVTEIGSPARSPTTTVEETLFPVGIRISRCSVFEMIADAIVVFIHKRRPVLSGNCRLFFCLILILGAHHPCGQEHR